METGSSRSQSEAWKNEGGRRGWVVRGEAVLCVHSRVYVCVVAPPKPPCIVILPPACSLSLNQ